MVASRLYVVATPIGNDDDLGPRARTILSSVECIAAEDTRVTRGLLGRLGIPAPVLVSYHDHNEERRVPGLLRRLLGGQDVALVSDAGTPLVSDPGYRLVAAAVEAEVPVVVIPGACAAVAALAGSGLPPDRFVMLGFLPRDAGPRAALLRRYSRERATRVLYAAPHRVLAVLEDVAAAWGPTRRVAIARSLTKNHESWVRGTVAEVRARLGADEEGVRGELTMVVEGYRPDDNEEESVPRELDALIRALVVAGLSVAQVRDIVAEVYDRPKRWVYQRALAARAGED